MGNFFILNKGMNVSRLAGQMTYLCLSLFLLYHFFKYPFIPFSYPYLHRLDSLACAWIILVSLKNIRLWGYHYSNKTTLMNSCCISLKGNAVQRYGYSSLGDLFKAAYKLATYSRQDLHRYSNFFSVSSNMSSVFLYSSKSACFKPWNFIDFSKQVSNIFVLLSFALCLAMLSVPALPLSPVRYLHDPVIHRNAAAPVTCWWRWECQNRKHGCGRTLQTLLGALANVLLGWDVRVKHLVILNYFLLKPGLREPQMEWSALYFALSDSGLDS